MAHQKKSPWRTWQSEARAQTPGQKTYQAIMKGQYHGLDITFVLCYYKVKEGGHPMERKNNYAIQAQNAKKIFLSYDQNALAEKLGLRTDDRYLYTALLGQPYRIARKTGDLERLENGAWIDANSFDEVLTLLDLVCDSRADRHPAGIWKNMTDFGHQFHQNLMESRDALADFAQEQPDAYCAALKKLGARPLRGADIAYAIPVFDNLEMAVFFWAGDEEFPPSIRYLWDENALQYIRYETMYYCLGCLRSRVLGI